MRSFIKKTIEKFDRHLHLEIDQFPEGGIEALPNTLWAFMWFFIRQIKGLVVFLLCVELVVAISSSLVFWYVGVLVKQGDYSQALMLGGLGLLVCRQIIIGMVHGVYDLVFTPYVGNMIRRQLYWYTARQSLAFFQNDFAGRIANKLIQSAPSLRDAVKSAIRSVWFASVFTISNLWFMANVNIWLAVPLLVWVALYGCVLYYFVPRVQKRSELHSHVMSHLTGQIVDSFTNFLPIKYFARTEDEDKRVIGLLRDHGRTFRATTGTIWCMSLVIDVLNTALLVATALVAFWLIDTQGQVGLAAMAMALPMALQATFQSGWIMYEVSGISENIGRVQEGIEALTKPHDVLDRKDAKLLSMPDTKADIVFDRVSFHYGQAGKPVLHDFNLVIPAGQKVGLVGRSGAGKSTITSLIVRAFDVSSGEIRIAGQNIAAVTQDSLRSQITVVTQDSYLFHRSVQDNIRYGRPDASMEEVIDAAKRASAHDFIMEVSDNKGRKAYDAHVGERGVKLSGGQKQRIGIARAILKDAPILILDEATSALDSESEHAIQKALEGIMAGKTVLAIAHRLSTLRQMDRILVMDAGRIVEDGTHETLIADPDGHYAMLWRMQSGGFLADE